MGWIWQMKRRAVLEVTPEGGIPTRKDLTLNGALSLASGGLPLFFKNFYQLFLN
jgi:hypothetical protein